MAWLLTDREEENQENQRLVLQGLKMNLKSTDMFQFAHE